MTASHVHLNGEERKAVTEKDPVRHGPYAPPSLIPAPQPGEHIGIRVSKNCPMWLQNKCKQWFEIITILNTTNQTNYSPRLGQKKQAFLHGWNLLFNIEHIRKQM